MKEKTLPKNFRLISYQNRDHSSITIIWDTFGLHVGRAIHSYLFAADTEIFTTYEKFTDPNAPYKDISDYNITF